ANGVVILAATRRVSRRGAELNAAVPSDGCMGSDCWRWTRSGARAGGKPGPEQLARSILVPVVLIVIDVPAFRPDPLCRQFHVRPPVSACRLHGSREPCRAAGFETD